MNRNRTNRVFDFFFLKRVFAKLTAALIVLAGVFAYSAMPKESLPDLEIPQALVITVWPGASPSIVEAEVTTPIEQKLKTITSINRFRSGSLDSMSIISVEFDVEAPVKESLQILRDKIAEATPYLPEKAKKPYVEAFSVTDIPVATLALHGTADEAMLSRLAQDVKRRLERKRGVKKAEVNGVGKSVIEIALNPERIGALGIPPTLVMHKLRDANADLSFGDFEQSGLKTSMNMKGKFKRLEDLVHLPIIRFDGRRVVELDEIAEINQFMEKKTTITSLSLSGDEFKGSATVSVYKVPGADTIEVVEMVKEELAAARSDSIWPSSVDIALLFDESMSIQERLDTMFDNAWQTMLIVFIVLLIVLSWREAIVAGLSIPLTFLGTIWVLHILGYTLNELVIIGLVLSLGLLVDDFILILEGMHEGIYAKGYPFKKAAIQTVKAYALPSLSGSLTTILVFIPLLFIGGIDGKFIRLIPVTMAICLTLSFLISLVIDIPLSYYVFKNRRDSDRVSRMDRVAARGASWLKNRLLDTTLKSKKSAAVRFALTLFTFLICAASMALLPSTLYPKADGRNLGITIELTPKSKLKASEKIASDVGEILKGKEYFESVVKYVGRRSPFSEASISDWLTPSTGTHIVGFSCRFVHRDNRESDSFEITPTLRREIEQKVLSELPGAKLFFSLQTGGSSSEDPIQIDIMGKDMDTLRRLTGEVKRRLGDVDGISDIRDITGTTYSEIKMHPRREALDFYGLDQEEFAIQARAFFTWDEIGKFQDADTSKEMPILLGTGWPSRNGEMGGPKDFDDLARVAVTTEQGFRIPILSLTDTRLDRAPISFTHKNGHRVATIMAQTDGKPISELNDEIQGLLADVARSWPSGYRYSIGGEIEAVEATSGDSTRVLLVSILLVFSVLALLFGSFKQPFIIMFSVPFALIGTFGGFFLIGMPLSFPAMIGIISLVGIVVNNAIVMIEKMNEHHGSGESPRMSAARGAADRLRPIVSTTVTTTVGLTPLALSSAEWMPLCLAIILGLLAATFVSLAIIPGLYMMLCGPAESS